RIHVRRRAARHREPLAGERRRDRRADEEVLRRHAATPPAARRRVAERAARDGEGCALVRAVLLGGVRAAGRLAAVATPRLSASPTDTFSVTRSLLKGSAVERRADRAIESRLAFARVAEGDDDEDRVRVSARVEF